MEHLLKEGDILHKWIPVKKRFPEKSGDYTVLIFDGETSRTSDSEFFIPSGRYGKSLEKGFIDYGVTHWQESVVITADMISKLNDSIGFGMFLMDLAEGIHNKTFAKQPMSDDELKKLSEDMYKLYMSSDNKYGKLYKNK